MGSGRDEVCPSEALPDLGLNGVVYHNGKGYFYTYRDYQFLSFQGERVLECMHQDCNVTACMASGAGSPIRDTSSHCHPPDPLYRDKCILLHTIRLRFLQEVTPACAILQDILSSLPPELTGEKSTAHNLGSICVGEDGQSIEVIKVEPMDIKLDDENDTTDLENDSISYNEENHELLKPRTTENLLEQTATYMEMPLSQSNIQTHVKHKAHSDTFSLTSLPSTSTSIKKKTNKVVGDDTLEDLSSIMSGNETQKRRANTEKEFLDTSAKKMKFSVVKFVKENDAPAVVATKWLFNDNTMTYYPKVRTDHQRNQLVQSQADPTSEWSRCAVEVLSQIDSFFDAYWFLREAEERSDFESSDEESIITESEIKKRKIQNLSGEDLSDNESCDNPSTEIPTKSVPHQNALQLPPLPPPSENTRFHSQPVEFYQTSFTSPAASIFSTSAATPLSPPSQSASIPSTSSSVSAHKTHTPNSSQIISLPPTTQSLPYPKLLSPLTDWVHQAALLDVSVEDNDRLVLLQLKSTLTDINALVHKNSEKLNSFLANNHLENEDELSRNLFGVLPIGDLTSFQEFEENLKDEKVTKQFVSLLKSVGGKDLRSLLKNIMRRTLTSELGTKFSFLGKLVKKDTSKIAFSKTNVCSCIHAAAKKVFPKEGTDDEIKIFVSNWLRQAKFRVERRQKR